MAQIILNIEDEKKSKAVVSFLAELGLIDAKKPQKEKRNITDFFKSAGIWKGRDVDLTELRKKAWRHGTL